ncbi:RAMP superfamily [Sulfidibacter corallicola]|uniref:CRISPR type III-associated protein domain-containing protein n=1 Tax=Sulfidibacter corallicola TaxID=2818388 RepID=A0A8A4TJJ2_SULCO|nr:RAMP superfamily CRISPR-associated protein [Sulfidibacter corallicola]QTD49763.1 hypothetical protein J3U87_29620 [Sulfidibacter corallicola]
MGIVHISRPSEAGPDRREDIPSHDVFREDAISGLLEFMYESLGDGLVSPGNGRLELTDQPKSVAQGVARRNREPVIPGSGIKGAVRGRYELLSQSCITFAGKSCRGQYCEACGLFGTMGVQGRVSFTDAVPKGEISRIVSQVPMPWSHSDMQKQKAFRLYDSRPANYPTPRGQPVKMLTRVFYRGSFCGTMQLRNVLPEELGRLLLVMGFDKSLNMVAPLRLGGAKYDGHGAMRLVPHTLRTLGHQREFLGQTECRERCRSWIISAMGTAWHHQFKQTLEIVNQLTSHQGSAP